jgi:2-polyprenyl-6-methoxyphenol hydroxylase-like FAD-dependent oxidoreductase
MIARTERAASSSRRIPVSVLVAGGGPSGAAAAIRLAAHGLDVTLCDAPSRPPLIGERLAGQCAVALQTLGVWTSFLSGGHRPSPGVVSAWASSTPTVVDGFFDPFGPAWHLDRPAFDTMLRDAAEHAGVRMLRQTRVTGATQTRSGTWIVTLRSQRGQTTCAADVVIDARGRQHHDLEGRPRRFHDRLVATVFVFDSPLRDPQPEWTLIESCQGGWWYSAPLPGARASVAYFTDWDLRPTWTGVRQLTRVTGAHLTSDRLPLAATPGVTVNCPAWSVIGHDTLGGTLLPVGDATAARDPLSGSGLCRSLDTAIQAADAIAAFSAGERDALDVYVSSLESSSVSYAEARSRVYALERRWPDAPFWRRRIADQPTAP